MVGTNWGPGSSNTRKTIHFGLSSVNQFCHFILDVQMDFTGSFVAVNVNATTEHHNVTR